MDSSHSHQVAVVTGAAGGLGQVTARLLAERGAIVACGDLDGEAAEKLAESIQRAGGHASGRAVDISSEESVVRWRRHILTHMGPPALVLNVAGVLERRMMADLPHEAFLHSLSVNLGGSYLVTRTFAQDLIAGPWGRVVNVASIAGLIGYPYPAYAASKAGVVNLTRSLVLDFWGTGVTVNAVCPGAMETPMVKRDALAAMVERTPTGNLVTTDQVAETMLFLCMEAAAGINGAALVVDGGATAHFRYFAD